MFRPHRFRPLALTAPIAFALAFFAPSTALLAQDGTECDCSCEAYQRLHAAVEDMQRRGQEGERVMPPPELQTMAACAGQCAMAWSECRTPQRDKRKRDVSTDRPDAQRREEAEHEPYALGEPRQDLHRFYGVYGSADEPGRDFFVARAENRMMEGRGIPPGYLMVGAMWGDVAPWYMKSLGELRFEQQWTRPGAEPLVVEFETDENGNAVAMRFLSGFLADRGRVEREGELPEGW